MDLLRKLPTTAEVDSLIQEQQDLLGEGVNNCCWLGGKKRLEQLKLFRETVESLDEEKDKRRGLLAAMEEALANPSKAEEILRGILDGTAEVDRGLTLSKELPPWNSPILEDYEWEALQEGDSKVISTLNLDIRPGDYIIVEKAGGKGETMTVRVERTQISPTIHDDLKVNLLTLKLDNATVEP